MGAVLCYLGFESFCDKKPSRQATFNVQDNVLEGMSSMFTNANDEISKREKEREREKERKRERKIQKINILKT